MKKKQLKTLLAASVYLLSSGLSALASTEVTTLPFSQQQAGKSGTPFVLDGQTYWAMTSRKQGLNLFSQDGSLLMSESGNFSDVHWFKGMLSALDLETDTVKLWALSEDKTSLNLLTSWSGTTAETETLCWAAGAEGESYLFTADATGMVEQHMLLNDPASKAFSLASVRRFVGALNTTACAVDEAAQVLYLAEEKAGVWQYPIDPEADPERKLVVATAPYGPIKGEIKGLTFQEGAGLFVSAPEQHGIWWFGPSFEKQTFIAANGQREPEMLGSHAFGDAVVIAAHDESADEYLKVTVTLDTAPSVSKPPPQSFVELPPLAQTTPVNKHGDAADDPAIWVNRHTPEQSLVLGTDKKSGLMVYNLSGQKRQTLAVGRVNNVDVRYGFNLGGAQVDIAAASNRTTNSISFFAIAPDSGVVRHINDIPVGLSDPYGLCMARLGGDFFVYINSTDGAFEQYLVTEQDGQVRATRVHTFTVPSQPEGCVVDDNSAELFYGEEAAGVWHTTAKPVESEPRLIMPIDRSFVADVEGMGIYRFDNARYLVVSSQGNNSFAVFALDDDNRYLGSFRVGMNLSAGLDGVSETDGLEVLSTALGDKLPDGLMVVQDGRNNFPLAPQNFKLIDGSLLKNFIRTHSAR